MNMSYSTPSLLLRFGAIILLVMQSTTTTVAAFRVDGQNSPPRSTDIPSIVATPQFDLPILKEESSSSMMTINLVGEAMVVSDAVPIDRSKSLYEFFTLHPHIFLRGSKNNKIIELDIDIEDELHSYEQGLDNIHITKPNDNIIRFFEVTSPGLSLPGIQVHSTATIAVEISKKKSSYPSMELTVIRDKTSIKGGLFNKIGNNNSPTDDKTTTISVHKINVVPKESNLVVFESKANLSLSIDLPSILSAKHIIERSGSSSIQKMLESDLSVSLKTFHQEYVRWLEGSTSTSNGSLTMKRLKSRSRRPQVVKRWFKKIIYSWFI